MEYSIPSIFVLGIIFVALASNAFCAPSGDGYKPPRCVTVPTVDDAINTLVASHPRLIAKAEDFDRVSKIIKTDKFAADWYGYLKSEADRVLSEPPREYEIPDGKRLLFVSREVLFRVVTLSLVCRIEGDDKYARRAWAELENAGNFKDWNPSHYLDTAEMCLAFAIGYDWLYDKLDDSQRKFIEDAIEDKAIKVALDEAYFQGYLWFDRVGHNWNQVCNGGLLAGALAIADVKPEVCSELIHKAVGSLPRAASNYAPDGAWDEGPGYWGYGTSFNVVAVAVLESALGTDFGLTSLEGFDKAALFPVYMTSPTAHTFNFCDSKDKSVRSSALLWFAKRYNYPVAADYFRSMMRRHSKLDAGRLAALGLIWYDPAVKTADGELPEPLNIKFREVECAAFRENFTDNDGMFLAFKGGRPSVNHGNIDSGSFIFDALGERWVLDLGPENYNIPEYFGAKRWTYYRMRAEGHNTLVINPAGQKEDQDADAVSHIIEFDDNIKNSKALIDLTDAYRDFGVSDIKRSFELLTDGDKRFATITDKITPADGKPADIWWFMHTEAEVALAADGKTATLSIGNKKLNVELLSPQSAIFEVMDAVALPMSPNPPESNPNKGVKKLVIHLDNTSEATTIQVKLIPQYK